MSEVEEESLIEVANFEMVDMNAEFLERDATDADGQSLKELLYNFDMVSVMPYLRAAQITYRSLQYLKHEDLKEVIPIVGLRAEFREKLLIWKKKKFGIDEDTMSLPSKVQDWLNEMWNSASESPVPSSKYSCLPLEKDLKSLLLQTSKGKSILAFYDKEKQLADVNRNDVINIIVEDAMFTNRDLTPKDFSNIVEDICRVFPTEKNVKEYYFIPRDGKKNPSGKLYAKYVNSKTKRRKFGSSLSLCETSSCSNPGYFNEVELNDSILYSFKDYLSKDSDNWAEITEKWEQTFYIRQQDLKTMSSNDFINAWPKYKDTRFPQLVNIDFSMMYPQKNDGLFYNWEAFKEKIKQFYESNINNPFCKQLFSILKSSTDKDTQDYMTCTLLNAVLPATTRFKNQIGKHNKKLTMIDAHESFAVRILSINDYQRKIDELVNKYYAEGLTIQPLLIVEGPSDEQLSGFYLYFDTYLYKFDSFLTSMDACFKIFHALSLNYPKACEPLWVFIQQYFFNIHLTSDCKSSNLTSLLDFLKIN